MIRILIVDDDATVTMNLIEFLASSDYEVVGAADSGEQAVQMARTLQPDLVLMDIRMPGKIDGIHAARSIRSEMDAQIVFISGYANEPLLNRAAMIEPLGYIHKPFTDEQISAALKMASYKISRKRVSGKDSDEFPPVYREFTPMEARIAAMLEQGQGTKQICEELDLSPATVLWHRKNIRKKLGIKETKKSIMNTLIER